MIDICTVGISLKKRMSFYTFFLDGGITSHSGVYGGIDKRRPRIADKVIFKSFGEMGLPIQPLY